MKRDLDTAKAEKNSKETMRATSSGLIEMKLSSRSSNLDSGSAPVTRVLPVSAESSNSPSQKRRERRKQRRAGVKVLVRLRPGDWKDQQFEEILSTRNATRADLYVISASKFYYKLMPLRVTFPFDAAHDSTSTSENTAEIVRLDHLPDGRVGIAILLRQPNAPAAKKSDSAGKNEVERRFAVRHMVSALAKLTELQSGIHLEGRCSDLSMAGCYIDTLNPFPEKSKVHLKLSKNQTAFEVSAHVVSHHAGMGMGLRFDGVNPEQRSMLVDWLSKRTAPFVVAVESSATAGDSGNPKIPAVLDRALIAKLLRLLETDKTNVVEVAY